MKTLKTTIFGTAALLSFIAAARHFADAPALVTWTLTTLGCILSVETWISHNSIN